MPVARHTEQRQKGWWREVGSRRCLGAHTSRLDTRLSPPALPLPRLQFGIVDNRSMFVSFEGQVSAKTPKFVVRHGWCAPSPNGPGSLQPQSVSQPRQAASALVPLWHCLHASVRCVGSREAAAL